MNVATIERTKSKAFVLPPVRRLIKPDPGHIIIDCDMSGADAQVVAWEADDTDLKAAFRAGLKVHIKNYEDMWQKKFNPEVDKVKVQPGHLYTPYDEMKRAVHATNYTGTARTVAITLQWKVSQAESFQRRWFQLHPRIKEWHRRVEKDLQLKRTVTNKFGYRRIYFDRPEAVLSEAVAWIPQSTIGYLAAKGGVNLHKFVPWVQVLMQVHDSLVFQVPFHRMTAPSLSCIKRHLYTPVPYPDPLLVDWSIAASSKSWGDCNKISWESGL